jgi:hypothetical protein
VGRRRRAARSPARSGLRPGGWLGIDADQVTASLHEDAGWGSIQRGGTGPGSRLHASLPSGWLARVWAAGWRYSAAIWSSTCWM